MLELDCGLDFAAERDADFFSLIPAKPGVCLIQSSEAAAEPYLIRTADLRRRLQRLLSAPDPASKRLNLRDFAAQVRYRLTASAFEQMLTYYQQARLRFPKRYRDLLRLRPAAVLKVSLRNAYPRCYVTRRIAVNEQGLPVQGAYYGPFASRRSAEAFAEKMLDFFKVRRCQIKIRRDPAFPGCIYSEMKMCLAPCFAGCTKEEYEGEVDRLVSFLETKGGSLHGQLEEERERASAELDFEKAAAIHKRLEKLDDVLRGQPELARKIQDLDAVILQRTAEEQAVMLYAVRGGRLAEPFTLRFDDTSAPRSAEETVRDYLEGVTNAAPHSENARQSAVELGEHLWLLARWFFSNPREGEIFFRDKDWPYRRILRGCSRLLAPKVTEEQTQPGAKAKGKEAR
ncbi:MAG TPA: UvrB/UvrC motif-containing protein [Candidatus Acidoferrum sp.]